MSDLHTEQEIEILDQTIQSLSKKRSDLIHTLRVGHIRSLKERSFNLVEDSVDGFINDLIAVDVDIQREVILNVIDNAYTHYENGLGDVNVRKALRSFPLVLQHIKNQNK